MASNQFNNNNNNGNSKHCAFCRRNKEPEETYKSHQLRKDGLVVCPQLFKHRCELCGATGNNAHTRSYCPLAQNFRRQCQLTKEEDESINNCMPEHAPSDLFKLEPPMFSNMAKVTNTKYNSAGKVRFSHRDQHNHQSGSRPRFANNRNNNDWNQLNHHNQQNRSNLNIAMTTSHQFMMPFQAQASTSWSSSSSSNNLNPYWSSPLTSDPMFSNQQFNQQQQQQQPFRRAQTQSRVQRNDRNFAGDSI